MTNSRTFAFIFARGGSKGLPGKNIRELGGIPLLAYGIRLAQRMDRVERVFVSTDDAEIAAVARRFGAEVIDRPAELASDTASEWHAWQHAIKQLRDERGLDFDVFLSLPATSPLRNEGDVLCCLDALDESADVVITVSPSARSPYFNMVSTDESGYAKIVLGDAHFKRRQDVPEVYDITTVAYVSRPDFILNSERIFAGRVRTVVVPKERAVDIDDEFDFKIAEALLQS
ncbi:cytidylyltransferase domain-containing protein [Jeongeupia naejangsanensis]|uniref:Acylneuraminate cytidylyltransferase family protein n=1 Tax=Jeongeupia naejangsanensis TaxID=613195 RepID=A0ABS2BRH3_9NEIS|nr:acylneuraminate cytidylyltransferase family protein [Jeongeupia naejangsanensis]MBM3117394.1 acylneuraminate cytidylyltransferase family protein [Jeongeupia naejangsanensis]